MLSTMVDILSDEVYRNILLKFKEDSANQTELPASPELLATFYTGGIVQLFRLWFLYRNNFSEDSFFDELEKILGHFNLY